MRLAAGGLSTRNRHVSFQRSNTVPFNYFIDLTSETRNSLFQICRDEPSYFVMKTDCATNIELHQYDETNFHSRKINIATP